MIPFGMFPQGADLSCFPSYSGPPDTEVPNGTINGTNAVFTLSRVPTVVSVFKDGIKLKAGTGYILSGNTVTFQAGYIPQSGDTVEVEVW